MDCIIGVKKGMMRVYDGLKSVPVTVVDVTDAVVARKDNGGVEIGFGRKRGNRAIEGKYKDLGYVPAKTVWVAGEFGDMKVGDKLDPATFEVGARVSVTGRSKGKGFAGVVKRWGFAGGPRTHGQSDRLRAPGSIGAGTTPGRVFKGKKMAGRMGGDKVTVLNKKIVSSVEGYLMVSGALPGNKGDFLVIKMRKQN